MKISQLSHHFSNKATSHVKIVGFTMVELLVVIAIIGLLAAGILAALNPIEQINKARDTGLRSDATQLSSAVDAYFVSKFVYPWVTAAVANPGQGALNDQEQFFQLNPNANNAVTRLTAVMNEIAAVGIVKDSFKTKVIANNDLFWHKPTGAGKPTYVCFRPTSTAGLQEAKDRCLVAGSYQDMDATFRAIVCPPNQNSTAFLVCVP